MALSLDDRVTTLEDQVGNLLAIAGSLSSTYVPKLQWKQLDLQRLADLQVTLTAIQNDLNSIKIKLGLPTP